MIIPKLPIDIFCANVHSDRGFLAKWREDKPEYGQTFTWARGYLYGGHMAEVMWGAEQLTSPDAGLPVGTHSCFAEALYHLMDLGNAGLGDGRGIPYADFARLATLATLAHDLGKAGGEFQYMLHLNEHYYKTACEQRGFVDPLTQEQARLVQTDLSACYRYKQAYRHEFLSAILLWQEPAIRGWFENAAGSDANFRMVLAGAFGHHLKTDVDKAVRASVFENSHFEHKPVFLSKLTPTIRGLARRHLKGLPDFPVLTDWPSDHPVLKNPTTLTNVLVQDVSEGLFTSGRTGSVRETPVSAAIKWIVILADTFGSMSAKHGESSTQTHARLHKVLSEVFQTPCVNYNDRILSRFINPDQGTAIARELWDMELGDVSELDKQELLDNKYNVFQRGCANVSGNLMAVASTGVGKTVGSIANAALHPELRLIYATPTTDTATRLHIGYADLEEDSIRHGNAKLDLLDTYTDDPADMAAEQADTKAAMDVLRYRADAGITFCTVDQVVGLCAFYRKSVMWLLYLVQSQVVFDEFHSYDPHLLGWYVKFLHWFPNLRTAHLSATVPTALETRVQSALTNCTVVRDEVGHETRHGVETLTAKSTPRYQMHVITNPHTYFGPGTLWVTNTVARCQYVGSQYSDSVVYHSRFRSKDRWGIRDRVVQMFDRNNTERCGRVVATQVCEMSLDISAHCLISEACPPAALIQRMGRANRYLDAPGGVAHVYVYLPDPELYTSETPMNSGLPYVTAHDWQPTYAEYLNFVQSLEGRNISQADLEAAFQKYCAKNTPKQNTDIEQNTEMLHTGRHSVRQGSITTACILRSDYLANYQEKMGKQTAAELSFPAILNRQQRDLMFVPGNMVHHKFILNDVPGTSVHGHYDSRLGWQNH